MLSRKLAAIFAAVATAIPLATSSVAISAPASMPTAVPLSFESGPHESRYGGALVVTPTHRARIDESLSVQPSHTALSRRLEALQQRFGNLMPDVKIVVMDKDWFQQNAILNGARAQQYEQNDDEKSVMRRLASFYVRSKTQIAFDPSVFEALERDVLGTEGMALKFQYGDSAEAARDSSQNICFLFPHFADKSRDQYYETLIRRDPSINGALAQAPLRNPMDYEYMKRFVDYHEIGHCYDRWYVKAIKQADNPRTALESRHKAEIYGEVFANLMLARDGYTDFSQRQADLRLAIAAFGGPFSARVNNPASIQFYMTYAYMLHEGSRNAQQDIERLGTARLQRMSMEDILELAHQITERSALDINHAPVAVAYMMSKRYDLSGWEPERTRSESHEIVYQMMVRLKADMEGAVRRVFDFGDRTEPVLQPASFNFENPVFRFESAAAQQARVAQLGRELRQGMGAAPTPYNLIQVYQRRKDSLRQVLHTGNSTAQRDAARDLSLMQQALKHAYDSLPENLQRNQPATDFSIPLRTQWSSPVPATVSWATGSRLQGPV